MSIDDNMTGNEDPSKASESIENGDPRLDVDNNTTATNGTSNLMDVEKQDETSNSSNGILETIGASTATTARMNIEPVVNGGHMPSNHATSSSAKAANEQANNTSLVPETKVPLQESSMAEQDNEELRPAKKQKQDTSSMDVSLDSSDTAGDTSMVNNNSKEPAQVANHASNESNQVVEPVREGTDSSPQVVAASSTTNSSPTTNDILPSIAEIIHLEDLPEEVLPLECLTLRDVAELESSLQIGDTYSYDDDDGWKSDWIGILLLCEKEVIINKGYLVNQPNAKPIRLRYCDWVLSNATAGNGLRGLELLFRYVYNMKDTPEHAKKILAYAIRRPAQSAEERRQFIIDATHRVSYDPEVLQQDGWVIQKAESPDGGEAYYIGSRIFWQKHEAIVIAFTHDETYGGLWKAVYVDDLETFDLEPGELKKAIKQWENKLRQNSNKRTSRTTPSGSTRFAATANFTVDGIEDGIILAVSNSKAAQEVLWPARVRHVVEGNLTASGNVRRNSSKNQIQLVFLAPFWNGQQASSRVRSADGTDPYSLGPLFEFETIEVSEDNIQRFPFESISLEKVRGSFRFLGLPKAVFPRYLDAQRLAVALKKYSMKHIAKASGSSEASSAAAAMVESHALSVRCPQFPQVALNVPFEFILNKLPHPSDLASASVGTDNDDDESNDTEPTIDIGAIVESMTPPECFGKKQPTAAGESVLIETPRDNDMILSPTPTFTPAGQTGIAAKEVALPEKQQDETALWSINKFASDFLVGLFSAVASGDDLAIDGLAYMNRLLTSIITKLKQLSEAFAGYSTSKRKAEMKSTLCQILLIKSQGEDTLDYGTLPSGVSKTTVVTEWRKTCERIYKRAVSKLTSNMPGVGNNVTSVLTDSRCNGHITQGGSFERPVRIPAALKGAKYAGAGQDPNILLLTEVEDQYLEVAEHAISKAHKESYIKRLKARVASIPPGQIVPLTEDSEGEGGEDTMGSRGSYQAAVVGVAACCKATDMVVGGECVNAFCATRPPGHHAGQELRSMKAISNGFCLFNGAACAALYATTPISQGGLGLRRVAIIDFDVHHGNGTQDCLCPTYDPRFLYVSLHAGGAHINGYDNEDSDEEEFRLRLGGKRQGDGIFPGRCGDTSPHAGVLNIPLGQRVTASAMGTALVSQVTPKVESFSPDLIILSAGFDAHVNDPLGMGGLTAEDFRSVTEVACQMAYKTCSGRILSLLEGGYGVPCCQPRDDLFLPSNTNNTEERYLHLGADVLPADMKDEVPFTLRQKLDRCHAEGFIECVKEHVKGFVKSNKRK